MDMRQSIILTTIIITAICTAVFGQNNYTSYHWFQEGNRFLDEGDRLSTEGFNQSIFTDYELAENCFDKAIELDSKNAIIWYEKGRSLNGELKFAEAIHAYDQAINMSPLFADAWFRRGKCLDALGRNQEALSSYIKASKLDPINYKSYYLQSLNNFRNNIYFDLKMVYAFVIFIILIFMLYLRFKKFGRWIEYLVLSKSSLEDSLLQESGKIEHAIRNFKVIRSRTWGIVFVFLPFIALLDSIYLVLVGFISPLMFVDYMGASALVAVAFALFAFQHLMKLIPKALNDLWSRNILVNPMDQLTLEEQYLSFIQNFETQLNGFHQWIMGFTWAILGFVVGLFNFRFDIAGLQFWYNISEIIILYPFIGLVIGIMVWRIIVIGWQISQIGRKFNLSPQPENPDGCGGLEPLGNLCLWNAMIVSIMAIWLGAWIILVSIPPFDMYGSQYRSVQSTLLLIPIATSLIAFFLPLLRMHNLMEAEKTKLYRDLDKLDERINRLHQQMLDTSDMSNFEENDNTVKKLEQIRQVYNDDWRYPTWPFNASILRRFALSQSVPFLSLFGLGKPIIDIISNVVGFLTPK